MLTLKNVSMRYPCGKWALDKVSFSLQKGEMAFLTGHSGAGKSTLLKIIATLEHHLQGDIIFNNLNIKNIKKKHIPFYRRQLGLISQTPLLLMDRTVFNNVALPLVIAGYSYRDINGKVRAALDKVGLLNMENRYPGHLSGGEQQRIGIARAIVNKPTMLLADEPTGNLDPFLSQEIMNFFRQLNQVGVTVIIATHNINLIQQLPYRRLILNQGKLVELT